MRVAALTLATLASLASADMEAADAGLLRSGRCLTGCVAVAANHVQCSGKGLFDSACANLDLIEQSARSCVQSCKSSAVINSIILKTARQICEWGNQSGSSGGGNENTPGGGSESDGYGSTGGSTPGGSSPGGSSPGGNQPGNAGSPSGLGDSPSGGRPESGYGGRRSQRPSYGRAY